MKKLKGIKLKSAENKVVDKKEEKIELELNEEVLKKKKVIKK